MAEITFGIITDGKRLTKLTHCVQSIRALNVPTSEIIIAGDVPVIDGVTCLQMPDKAKGGNLGAMRNAICKEAKYNNIVICDDDIFYHPDWYIGFEKFIIEHPDYEVASCRLLNPDGTRNWDWVTTGGPRGHILLEYYETDKFQYITGGIIIIRKSVASRIGWNDTLGFNQGEDVEFSRRLQEAGIGLTMNRYSTATHDDPTYTSNGRTMMKLQ
jgi:hypothetical protein